MKNTDHFKIPYPETTDPLSQFPDQVAKPTAELIDTFLYEQEQKQTALDSALQGKAPLSHTHSTPQVTGLDAALAGKAPQATLDTRVPAGLALRVDTTVGTRIFAGDTMIYGDTGWRNITADLLAGETPGWNAIRRIGNVVYMTVQMNTIQLPNVGMLYNFPQGFDPKSGGTFRSFANDNTGHTWVVRPGALHTQTPKNGQTWLSLSFPTNDTWPTTLPGLPA